MTTLPYITLVILFTLTSCQTFQMKSEQNLTEQNEDLLIVGDIDTLKVIAKLAIRESASRLDLSSEKLNNLSDHLDTLELTYYFGFCDCQRWIVSSIYSLAKDDHPHVNESDPRGQIQFNLYEHGYYIEAASKELKINWRTQINGTKIKLIGREYKNIGLPKDGEFTVPDPPKGKVFRYYSYQFLRPYQIWGPHKFMEVDKETGDSISEQTILEVK